LSVNPLAQLTEVNLVYAACAPVAINLPYQDLLWVPLLLVFALPLSARWHYKRAINIGI